MSATEKPNWVGKQGEPGLPVSNEAEIFRKGAPGAQGIPCQMGNPVSKETISFIEGLLTPPENNMQTKKDKKRFVIILLLSVISMALAYIALFYNPIFFLFSFIILGLMFFQYYLFLKRE